MVVKRLNWLFSPLVFLLIFVSCKPDDHSSQHPAMQRHLADFERTGDLWGFIDTAGQIAIKARFDDVRAFQDGLAPANLNGAWGYIDKDGNWIIKPSYIKAQPFENGLARVRFANGLMGLITTRLDTLVEPMYDEIYLRNGIFFVTAKNDRKGLIKADGSIILKNEHDDVKIVLSQFIAIKKGDKFELRDEQQALIFDNVLAIKRGGILKTSTGWGIIDTSHNWLIKPTEESINLGHPGHIIVKRDDQPAILNLTTGQHTLVNANRLTYINANRYAAKHVNGWTLLDEKGKQLIDRPFESIYKYTEGVAAYCQDDWWGYIDVNGNIITDAIFALPWNSAEGKIRLFTPSGFGFHDRQGHLIVEPKFNDVRDFSEGLAAYME